MSFATTNFAAGTTPSTVVIGDFNGDGRPDLAVANLFSNSVSILLGTGAGTYGAATTFAVGTGPYSLAVGDLNGDGKLDLVVANQYNNNVSSLPHSSGDGSFGAATELRRGDEPRNAS